MNIPSELLLFYLDKKLLDLKKGGILRFSRTCMFRKNIQNITSYLVASVYVHNNLYYLEAIIVCDSRDNSHEQNNYIHMVEKANDEGRGNILIELLPTGECTGIFDLNTCLYSCGTNKRSLENLHSFLCSIAEIIDNKQVNKFTKRALYAILIADSFPMCISNSEFTHILKYWVPEYLHNEKTARVISNKKYIQI